MSTSMLTDDLKLAAESRAPGWNQKPIQLTSRKTLGSAEAEVEEYQEVVQ